MIDLADLGPAGEAGWSILLELAAERPADWVLIGGQMMYLLATERGRTMPRVTADMDVVVNVRSFREGTAWLAQWLAHRGFDQDKPSADGISHRFTKMLPDGRGAVIFDVLAPEGLGATTSLTTIPPGRTIEARGGSQALERTEVVDVRVHCDGLDSLTGRIPRPSLLAALVLKAAATSEIATRSNPERDWQDCALLLAMVEDPTLLKGELSMKDRGRIAALTPLPNREHDAWRPFGDDDYRRGTVTLDVLLAR